MIQNVCPKFGAPEDNLDFHQFAVNQAMSGISINICMWATVRLSKDGDQLQRVLRNMDVETTQKVFNTGAEPDPRSSRRRSVWSDRATGLKVSGNRTLCWIKDFSKKINSQKVYVVTDSVLRPGGQCQRPSTIARNLGARENCILCQNLIHIANFLTSPGASLVREEDLRRTTQILEEVQKTNGPQEQTASVPFQEWHHLFVDVQRHRLDPKHNEEKCRPNSSRVSG